MKKAKLEKAFLEELERLPNISMACRKVGLARQTVYRWMKEYGKFGTKVYKAMDLGIESICDLAESKLIENVNNGNQKAIEYTLTANHKRYYRPRKPKDAEEFKFVPVTEIHHLLFDPNKHARKMKKDDDPDEEDIPY